MDECVCVCEKLFVCFVFNLPSAIVCRICVLFCHGLRLALWTSVCEIHIFGKKSIFTFCLQMLACVCKKNIFSQKQKGKSDNIQKILFMKSYKKNFFIFIFVFPLLLILSHMTYICIYIYIKSLRGMVGFYFAKCCKNVFYFMQLK